MNATMSRSSRGNLMCHNIIGGDCSYFIEEKEKEIIFLVPIARLQKPS
jgi:hypothetical protein